MLNTTSIVNCVVEIKLYMEEKLIEFETAKLAKEKGFNIPCDGRWWIEPASSWKFSKQGVIKCDNSSDDSIARPTQSLLQKWLREIHNIHLEPKKNVDGYSCLVYPNYELDAEFWVNYIMEMTDPETRKKLIHKTYEEALEVGLLEGLKLIEL